VKREVFIRKVPGFICDFMLGRLAKWMRLMGFDTTYHRDTDGKTIIYHSREEGRTILTRSRILAEKYDDLILIRSEHLVEQLRQVAGIVDIKSPFSRCPVCNTEIEEVKKDRIKEKVPPYVFETHNGFKRCPQCGRIFWKGTHYKEIEKLINEIKS